MPTRKLSKEQWEFEIKRALRVRDAQRERMRKAKYRYFERFLGRFLILPYVIGLSAIVALIYFYGWQEFFKFFLSWIVSLTLVAAGAYYLWKYYERQL